MTVRQRTRRAEAEVRQTTRNALTLVQKLVLCTERPGESKRETARLTRQLSRAAEPVVQAAQKRAKKPA